MKIHKFAACAAAALLAHTAGAAITTGSVTTHYSNPYSGTENLTSFDWDGSGNLYWMGGDASWAQSMHVYKFDGSTLSTIDTRASYAGTWVNSFGDNIYYDDGSEYAFYKYGTAGGSSPSQVLQLDNSWGYTFQNDGLYITGADAGWNNVLYYSALDANGDLTGSLINLGYMGSPSGPTAFDADGNLYYGAGYGDGVIYKYSAADVAAAVAGTPLGAAAAHQYIDFNGYGLDGASGMDFNADGNLVVSLTSFGSPSKLVEFDVDGSGNYTGNSSVWAVSDTRMTTVRNQSGTIYFSDSDGIYEAIPEPGTIALMLMGVIGLVGVRRFRT